MTTQIKITQLTDIGSANLAVTTLLPVVNMAGVPTTQKTTLGNLANVILSQSGSNFARVALANLSYAVSNAAQPNITSTGTLTSLSVSGNANIGNIGTAGLITATGNVGAGNLNTTGLVNAGTLSVTGTTNLGAVGNVTITGGTNGQVLTTNGSNVLSWTTVSSSSSNTAVTVTANAQPNITSVGNLSYLVVNGNVDATNIDTANTVYANYFVGDGSSITDIDATNVIGNVANANYSTYAGTVITGAQPNITSVGNLAGLTITGVTTLGTVTNLGDVGNVKIDGGIDGDVLGTDGANLFWVAQTDIGNFSFSNNIISLNVPANLVVNSDGQNFIVNANSRLFTYKPDGNLVLPGGSQIYDNSGNLNIASNGLLLSVGPNANVHSDWWFSNTGNLTLPANTFAINYANGTQVSLGGGSNIANGNSNVSIATANGNVTISAVGNTTMTVTGTGANVTGTLTSTGKIGYSTGGNATQTSTGQGVTINQLTGLVTLANRTYNAGDLEAFSISCNKVSNNDFVLVQMVDSVNAPSYNVVAYPNFVLANTISVLVKTLETVGTDTPILKFMIVKAPIA